MPLVFVINICLFSYLFVQYYFILLNFLFFNSYFLFYLCTFTLNQPSSFSYITSILNGIFSHIHAAFSLSKILLLAVKVTVSVDIFAWKGHFCGLVIWLRHFEIPSIQANFVRSEFKIVRKSHQNEVYIMQQH